MSSLESQGAQARFNDLDQSLYNLSKHYCEPLKNQSVAKRYFNAFQLKVFESSMLESVDHVVKVANKAYLPDTRLVGLLGELTQSVGFMAAMSECFEDEGERNGYVASLFVAERFAIFLNIYGFYKTGAWVITRFPAMIPVIKYTITFSMAVLTLQIPSSVDLNELKKLNVDQTDSRIKNLKSDLAKASADDQRKLKSEIKWLELKKSLDALN